MDDIVEIVVVAAAIDSERFTTAAYTTALAELDKTSNLNSATESDAAQKDESSHDLPEEN